MQVARRMTPRKAPRRWAGPSHRYTSHQLTCLILVGMLFALSLTSCSDHQPKLSTQPANTAPPVPGSGPPAAESRAAESLASGPTPLQPAIPAPQPTSRSRRQLLSEDDSQAFFRDGIIPRLHLRLEAGDARKLRENGRQYVPARVVENDQRTLDRVVVKLKGAAGSYQDLDARPAFTLKLRKPRENQLFHGLEKWHLNNSVQDESYLCELVCAQICHWAGIPTPRVTHARVWLNERDLGFYVLKESFDERFLARHFDAANGNLYDGGFVQDLDADLELDAGDGPLDRADLKELVSACRQEDPDVRREQVERTLDIKQFISFMALEAMTCHWDGYCFNRNNYRLYFDPPTKRAHFFPHGMDQMFGDPGFPLWQQPEPIVAAAIWLEPAWRQEYRKRVADLLPLFEPEKLFPVIDATAARIQQVLSELGEPAVQHHREQVAALKDRVRERARVMREMLDQPDPMPLAMQLNEPQVISEWYPVQESDEVQLEATETAGQPEWRIKCLRPGTHVASWRSKVLLGRGRYEFQALARSAKIIALDDDPNGSEVKGQGAGIRVSGSPRENQLTGDHPEQQLTFTFTVHEALRTVELVAELRAKEGQFWLRGPITLTKVAAE